MYSCLGRFRQSISELRAYLRLTSCLQKFAAEIRPENHSSSLESCILEIQGRSLESLPFRMRNYVGGIMGLSTAFEVFIDSLTQEYIRSIMEIFPSYNDLPEKIRSNHRKLTIDLVARFEQSRFKGQIEIEELFRRYHQCVSGSTPYELNEEAFLYRQANFKSEKLAEFFHRVMDKNILDGIIERKRMTEFLLEKSLVQKDFSILDNLAQRRNEAAHGEPNDILSDEMMILYIDYLEILCEELHDEVRSRYLERLCSVRGISVGHADKFVTENLVGFRNKEVSVQIGDILVSRSVGGFFRDSRVLELQRAGVPITKADRFDSVGLGVRFLHKAKENHEFFLILTPVIPAVVEVCLSPAEEHPHETQSDMLSAPDGDPDDDAERDDLGTYGPG